MQCDDKLLDDVWSVLQNITMRQILNFININGSYQYTEILRFVDKISPSKKYSGKTAYFVRKMLKADMIKLDTVTKRYFLTRIGVQSLMVMKDFEKICSKFDLNDCDADGKVYIESIVVGRKMHVDNPVKSIVSKKARQNHGSGMQK